MARKGVAAKVGLVAALSVSVAWASGVQESLRSSLMRMSEWAAAHVTSLPRSAAEAHSSATAPPTQDDSQPLSVGRAATRSDAVAASSSGDATDEGAASGAQGGSGVPEEAAVLESTAQATLANQCTSNLSNPNPGDPPPGGWANPKRANTGWSLAYDSQTGRMMVVWHTFFPGGSEANPKNPIWLVSDWAEVKAQPDKTRTWTSTLYRTTYGVSGGRAVGRVSLAFPDDSSTRAGLAWTWRDSIKINGSDVTIDATSADECIYNYLRDQPSPALSQPAIPSSSETGYYTGIWFDPSTPGFALDIDMVKKPDSWYTEVHDVDIYDTDGNPTWLFADMAAQFGWPSPGWQKAGLYQFVGKYDIAGRDCTSEACSTRHDFIGDNHFGRLFSGIDTGVASLVLNSSSPVSIHWPPLDWPAPTGDVSGCLDDRTKECRPIYRQTDKESLAVGASSCDIPPTQPGATCGIYVNWHGSPLGVVKRIDANTQSLKPHGVDKGIVGGGIQGETWDMLSADERVIYQLWIGDRLVASRDARGVLSAISAPRSCVVGSSQDKCSIVVSWSAPYDPNRPVHVDRVEKSANGTITRTNFASIASGSKADDVKRGTTVYYELFRELTWLASTKSNPTEPVDASVTVDRNICSVPPGLDGCPIKIEWLAGSTSASVNRVSTAPGGGSTNLTSGASGSYIDKLPAGSFVQYTVTANGVEQARSRDVAAITSRVSITNGASGCIVASGQNTCQIPIDWASTSEAEVYRVDETNNRRTKIGGLASGSATDALGVGVSIHYELTIAGVVHARTPTIMATASEGGDSEDGSAESPPSPTAFVEPALSADTDSDQVGAIAGEFRVDEGGAATYRIPLAVAPGAGGLSPTLAVVYSSSAGDSILGTGFALDGMSSIAPCRSSVEAGDVGDLSADPNQFCLDGRRLLLVGGTHRQVGAEYRTEIDSFQRIKLIGVETPTVSGSARTAYVFRAEGKDGVVRTYGGAAGAVFGRLDGAGLNVAQQAWMQTSLKDAAGNELQYQYSPIATLGERYLQTISYSGGSVVLSYMSSPRVDLAYSTLGQRVQSQLLNGIEIKGASGETLRYYDPAYDTSLWSQSRPRLLSIKECSRQGGTCYPATAFTWSNPSAEVNEFDGKLSSSLGYYKLGDLNGDQRADLWWTSNHPDGGRNNRLHVSKLSIPPQGVVELPALIEASISLADATLPDGFKNGGLWEAFDVNGDGRDDLLYAWSNRNGSECPRNDEWCKTHPNRLTWHRRVSNGSGLNQAEVLFYVDVDPGRAADISQEIAQQTAIEVAAQGTAAVDEQPASIDYTSLLGSSMLADIDGDGLADLVFRAPDGKFWVALMRRTRNVSEPFRFEPVAAVFLNEDGSSAESRCGFATADLTREEENFSQAMDFDGDGRADLRFVVNSSTCPEHQPYRLDIFLSKGRRASDGAFVFQAARPFGDIYAKGNSLSDAAQRLRTLDVNGDGIPDLVYADNQNTWHYRLGGSYAAKIDGCVAACTLNSAGDAIQLLDLDGDGKLDFWIRNGNSFDVYLWTGSNWSTTRVATQFHFPDNTWSRVTADFDGDGIADNFFVRPSDGTWHLQRTKNHHATRGYITGILNGLGASTQIDYAPLTFSFVYRRDYSGPLTVSGRGSPVFDVATPNYVVRSVRSSAPTSVDANAMSRVTYRYAGLKVQAGGRGSLGFRRITTFDMQNGIEVDSHYQQRFPFTGVTDFTETRRITLGPAETCSGTTAANDCIKYVAPCSPTNLSVTCDDDVSPSEDDARPTIKESSDTWEWRMGGGPSAQDSLCEILLPPVAAPSGTGAGPLASSGGGPIELPPEYECPGGIVVTPEPRDGHVLVDEQAPIFLARVSSLTSNFDLAKGATGGAISSESIDTPLDGYDRFGNPQSSKTVTSGGDTSVAVESRFVYENDSTNWKLGRLKTSTVKTERTMEGITSMLIRRSSFTYQANGLLTSEKVEGMTGWTPDDATVDTTTPAVATYYAYDRFGNRNKTSTCSTGIPESDCRAQDATGAGGYQFHPADPATIRRYAKSEYDTLGRFVERTREAYSTGGNGAVEKISSSVSSRNAAGDPLEVMDANNVGTKIRYGVMGRKRFTWSPNGASTRWDARYCNGTGLGSSTVPCPSGLALAYRSTTTTAGAPSTRTYYDVLGRPVLALSQGFEPGSWIAKLTKYDSRGNVVAQSDPYLAKDGDANAATPALLTTIYWTYTQYDALSRPTSTSYTALPQAITSIAYDGLKTVVTMPVNNEVGAVRYAQTRTELRNGLNEVVRSIDTNGNEVTTRYDASGQPVSIRHGAGATTMAYDTLGRKKSMSDPDAGMWTYDVNGAGEIIRQVDPRGACTRTLRDGRGRTWSRIDSVLSDCSAAERTATWSYDTASYGVGALAEESSAPAGITRTLSFDRLGRLIQTQSVQDGKTYTDQWTFDEVGRPFQHLFGTPGVPMTGERNVYRAEGFLSQVRSAYPFKSGVFAVYREIQAMNARGQVTKEYGAAGAGYRQEREYSPEGRLLRQTADTASGDQLQDFSYRYDAVGNVLSRKDGHARLVPTERFGYDALQRLVTSEVSYGGATVSRGQSYDAEGNLRTKGAATYTYGTRPSACATYAQPGPHAVTEVEGQSLCYDKSGNLVKKAGSRNQTLQYTAANQLSDVFDTTNNTHVRFDYGPNRERVRRLDYASTLTSTADTLVHWSGDAQIRYAVTTANGPGALQEVRRTVGNTVIVQSGSGNSYRLIRQIVLTDAQGSTHQVLGAMTLKPVNAASPTSFDAWGYRRDVTTWDAPVPWTAGLEGLLRSTTQQGYTGHEMVESAGLIHMNGRIYDPALARFIQADPFVQSGQNLQSWNRYTYAFNNPLAYTDPSGYMSFGQILRTAAAIAITVYTGGAAAGSWGFLGLTAAQASANAYAVLAVGGFAAGAVQTGSLKGAVTGSVTAMVFYGVGSTFTRAHGAEWMFSGKEGNDLSFAGYAAKTLAHGAAGGVMAQLQGGNFGHGFASAGFGEALSPAIGNIHSTPGQAVAVAVVGGTASVLAGGKFANGAVTASFGYAFNQVLHSDRASTRKADDGRPLTEGEIDAAKSEHPDLDIGPVRVKYDMSGSAAYTPNNTIHFPKSEIGCQDFATCDYGTNVGWFVHEVTHVWQYQQGRNPFWGHIFSRDIATFGDYLPLRDYVNTPSPSKLSTERQADWYKWHYLCTNKLQPGC